VEAIFTPMTLGDVPTIGALEVLCFPAPWSPDTYRNELLHNRFGSYWVLRPAPEYRANHPPILAYGGYWLMGDEVHIVTIATHPEYRRRGLSEYLLLQMIEQCRSQDARLVTLEVRASNRAAQQLYTKLGFVKVGLRRGYYQDNGEDALLMTLSLEPGVRLQEGASEPL
jgi:ribosomal-protein-alanine N-acetyltransferase